MFLLFQDMLSEHVLLGEDGDHQTMIPVYVSTYREFLMRYVAMSEKFGASSFRRTYNSGLAVFIKLICRSNPGFL